MNMTIKTALASLFLAGSMFATGTALAQDVKSHNFKVAFVQNIDHPHGIGAKKFGELLEQKSGGKMKAKAFGGGSLGGDAQVISSLQGGVVEMTLVSPGLLTGLIKEFSVFDLPFMFTSYREVDAVMDGPVGTRLLGMLTDKGLIGLGYWDHGFRNITNARRPINRMEDISGLKVRVIQIPIFIDTFSALGANPVPLPFPELYTALETGTVDGQENPFASIETSKFYEVQKYAATTGHVYNPLVAIFSKKIWDKLTEDERRIVQEAATEAGLYERKVSREANEKSMQTLRGEGMQITELSVEEIDRMRQKVKPVTDKYTQSIGPDLVAEVQAEIQKVRDGK
ncbi:tripartite ATP-independent transporter DctP family solute receptor [Skermanella aerolata]|uniref:ABC transporter substrate-binding protein n=1 Tax=Skermanella aerolata TaxID=393310 RepID=A0A512DTQ7_9PROT|nr:TRAP transporter substrate-binding protein [Skermanella aerolata]KJB92092.1 ABC transporter substrate-binding protein [Skermanella aerolata KACC 11604]GEO39845.1 ABC transporter substrate-binding protein [Skermanella aerolata]